MTHPPLDPRPSPLEAKRLRVLLTNDDGYDAPGMQVLERIARALTDDVWIVAPDTERSGASHQVTLMVPVRVRGVAEKIFAVSGTPSDCVMLAFKHLIPLQEKPVDLVLSGVNRGSNAGDDVIYSGTCAGAREAALHGVPAIALSLLFHDGQKIHWETAEAAGLALLTRLLEAGWPKDSFLNVNFPACPPEGVKGIIAAPQGNRHKRVPIHERKDPRNRTYYWFGGDRENTAADGSDVMWLEEGYVTVTPLMLEHTHTEAFGAFKNLFKVSA